MKFTRAIVTIFDHGDRTPSADADTNHDDVLEVNGMPTFGLTRG